MNKLNTLLIATLSALVLSGPALAEGVKTRADVVAELKAAHESGELQARALEMEGVGHVIPVPTDGRASIFAWAKKPSVKSADTAQAASKQPAARVERGSASDAR